MKWGELNGVNIIQTAPRHTSGTGDVDDLCFENDNKINYTLSRLGVTRLLSTLDRYSQEFQVCKDWENTKRQINAVVSNKTNDTVHKPQLYKNIIQPTTTSAQYQNVPKRSVNSPQAQKVQFHADTKTNSTQLLNSEPPNKSTSYTPNTWHRPQTNPTSVLAAPHSTPENRQTYQNNDVGDDAGQNRNPFHIRDSKYRRQENTQSTYPSTLQHGPYTPKNYYSYPHTSQY